MEIRKSNSLLSIVIFLVALGCVNNEQTASSQEVEAEATRQILALHELQKTDHFEKKAEEFVALLSDDYISVDGGTVSGIDRQAYIDRFQNYFDSVEFEKWDDIDPPIIRFSDDFSMAYTIVNKEVIVKYEEEDGTLQRDKTIFSWVAIYRKHQGEWKIDCVASTNKPGEKI